MFQTTPFISRRSCWLFTIFTICAVIVFIYTNFYPSFNLQFQYRIFRKKVFLQHQRLEYCNCDREIRVSKSEVMTSWNSTCSTSANLRGPFQKVVSFSFYGDVTSHYFQGVTSNAHSIATLYPGWVMRLYHNINRTNENGTRALCDVLCKYPHVDDCNVHSLPEPLGSSASDFLGSVWRFMVLGDPLVDTFISRDLDANMGQREVDAVQQWMNGSFTWHIMRDHIHHSFVILAGMWGVKNSNDLGLMTSLRSRILQVPRKTHKQFDQDILRDVFWPITKHDMLCHDSYLCEAFNDTIPYPTRRVDGFFIGNLHGSRLDKVCPVKCRPVDHKDWENC